MMLPKILNKILPVVAVFLCLIISASAFSEKKSSKPAVESYSWEFKADDDYLGWTPDSYRQVSVRGGSIKGLTNRLSFLHSPMMALDAGKIKQIEFIAKSDMSGVGSIYFRHSGEALADSRSVPIQIIGDKKFHKYTIDMSAVAEWKGTIEQIRLDLIYVPNANIEISRIDFKFPGKNIETDSQNLVINGGFEDYTPDGIDRWILPKNADAALDIKRIAGKDNAAVIRSNKSNTEYTIRQPIEFNETGFYILSVCAMPLNIAENDRLTVRLTYKNILLQPVKDTLVWNIPYKQLNKWSVYKKAFKLSELAAFADLSITVKSSKSDSEVCLDDISLQPDNMMNQKEAARSSSRAFSWRADWIWNPNPREDDVEPVYFQKTFKLSDKTKIKQARTIITADNECVLYVNGRKLPAGSNSRNWKRPDIYNIKPYLQFGSNVIMVKAVNHGGPAGMLAECGIDLSNGNTVYLKTDSTWKCSRKASGNWTSVAVIAHPPAGAWGDYVPYTYLGPCVQITVKNASCSKTLKAGSALHYKFILSSAAKYAHGTTLFVDLVRNGTDSGISVLRKELKVGSGDIRIDCYYRVPKFIPPGKYLLKISITNSKPTVISSPGAKAAGGYVILPVNIQPQSEKVISPACSLKMVNGSPMVIINGRPHTSMNYWVERTSVKGSIESCRANGIHIYFADMINTPLLKSGKFDFSSADEVCTSLLMQDPDAYIIPIISIDNICNPGLVKWTESNADEMVKNSEGSVDLPDYGGNPSHAPSMSSEKWMNLSESLLRQFIRHIRQSRYADRVIGYLPTAGVTYEWQQWGSVAYPPVFVDYSEPARRAFAQWAKNKYTDIDGLNKAWNTQLSGFNDIRIPSSKERLKTDKYTFLDPAKSRELIDYVQYYSEQVADDILRVARTIKDETGGRSFVGTFYGYVSYVLGPYRYQLIGHMALHKVLESKDIDYLISPSMYDDRQIGGGSGFMSAVGSVKLHNKIWIDQDDLRTHHSVQAMRFTSLSDSKAGLTRNYANTLVNDCIEQFMDFSTAWLTGDKRLMQLLGKLKNIEDKIAAVDRSADDRSNSIAVIIDEKSTYYTAMASTVHLDTVVNQYRELSRTGVGFDVYLLDDIDKIPDYKCYLFLNTFRITKQQQDIIDRMLKKSGKVLTFVYAPGYTDESILSPDGAARVTGMNFDLLNKEVLLRVITKASEDPILKYVPVNTSYGSYTAYGPALLPRDGESLGNIESMQERSGLVIKRFDNWTSIFSIAPVLPAQLIRGIAEYAGVTVANPSDGDVTFANGRLISVHSLDGGERTLHFGKDSKTITELLTGRTSPVKDGVAVFNMEPRSTAIFLAE